MMPINMINLNCPYLKIGLCNLFPVLLECVTYVEQGTSSITYLR